MSRGATLPRGCCRHYCAAPWSSAVRRLRCSCSRWSRCCWRCWPCAPAAPSPQHCWRAPRPLRSAIRRLPLRASPASVLRGAGHRVRAREPAAGAQRAWKSWRGESWQSQSPIWGLESHSLHPYQVQGRLWAGRTESKFTHEQPTSTSYSARDEKPLSWSPPDGTVLIITYIFEREVSGKVVCILHFFNC